MVRIALSIGGGADDRLCTTLLLKDENCFFKERKCQSTDMGHGSRGLYLISSKKFEIVLKSSKRCYGQDQNWQVSCLSYLYIIFQYYAIIPFFSVFNVSLLYIHHDTDLFHIIFEIFLSKIK